MIKSIKNQTGYIALTTVLIILAVVLITVTGITYSSIGEAQSGLALYKGEENLQLVEGCVEDVMLKVRSNPAFNGTTITRPEGTCTIFYFTPGPATWDFMVYSQTNAYQRVIRVIFFRTNTGITPAAWSEI